MTIRELVQYQQNNRVAELAKETPRLPNGSLPPEGHVNPYGDPSMDITGKSPDSYKIIPVDEGVANKMRELAKQIMLEGNGIDTGFGVNEAIKSHVMTLPPEDRINAGWTLNEIFHNEAVRLGEYIHQRDPNWNWGKPFDHSILDDYTPGGMDIKV